MKLAPLAVLPRHVHTLVHSLRFPCLVPAAQRRVRHRDRRRNGNASSAPLKPAPGQSINALSEYPRVWANRVEERAAAAATPAPSKEARCWFKGEPRQMYRVKEAVQGFGPS